MIWMVEIHPNRDSVSFRQDETFGAAGRQPEQRQAFLSQGECAEEEDAAKDRHAVQDGCSGDVVCKSRDGDVVGEKAEPDTVRQLAHVSLKAKLFGR